MNIFILSDYLTLKDNVHQCARWHTNRHVISQIKETAQLICNAVLKSSSPIVLELARAQIDMPCNSLGEGHNNHPCAKWLRLDEDHTQVNYHRIAYLANLGLALCLEKQHRWPLNARHQYHEWFEQLADYLNETYNLLYAPPDFPIAIASSQFQGQVIPIDDAVREYRAYYIRDKQSQAEWKNREVPYWYQIQSQES